jgi:hypothetical protein
MHESREKRSLSLLRSGRVRRRLLLLGGPSQSVRAHRARADHVFHINTFHSRSFTTHQHNSQLSPRQSRGSSWGPPA